MQSSDKRSNYPHERTPGTPSPRARLTRARNGYQWLALCFAVGVVWVGIPSVHAQTVFEKQVGHNDDDADEKADGTLLLDQNKLELGQQAWSGTRFLSMTIPNEACISSA